MAKELTNLNIPMKGVIFVENGAKRKIQLRCGLADATVKRALEGRSETNNAYRVRRLALLEYGGVVV